MVSPTSSPVAAREKVITAEGLGKIVTYALPAVYVFGFVILSLYEADFGIADFSFLKIKALATGLLFTFFVGFPALLGMRSFRLFGFQHGEGTRINVGANQEFYFYVMKVCDLFVSSTFSALILQFLFVHSLRSWVANPVYQEAGHFSWLVAAVGIVSLALYLMLFFETQQAKKHFSAKPVRCTAIVFLVAVAWVIWTLRMSDWLFFQLNAWCWLASICAWWVGSRIDKGIGLKARTWEIDIIVGFALSATWFATNMYGEIKPAFGGGAPIAAKIYLQQDNPVLGSKIVDTFIVEETEQGYYVANRSEHKNKTLFIPRSAVISVQLGNSPK